MEAQIVETARFMPAACTTCMSAAGPFADTSIDPPGYGRVYLCLRCVTEQIGRAHV